MTISWENLKFFYNSCPKPFSPVVFWVEIKDYVSEEIVVKNAHSSQALSHFMGV